MALTVVDRPYGFELGSAVTGFCIGNNYGFANVQKAAHGLTTGQYVYVVSDVSAYNGFWYVQVFTANEFYLRQNLASANQAFIRSTCNATYYVCTTHNWSCVHLPIVYRLSSNKWPINTADTIRTVSSQSDAFSYTNLNLSGAIGSVAGDLISVIVNGVSGLYRIIDWVSSSDVTINLAYNVSNTFGNVQDYANNYHARIRIYSGLDIPHTYRSMNPYAQTLEIRAVPDENGIITVNINEYLKSDINILSNDLLLGSRPNNVDAYCQFYIEYAESYDDSDGTDVGTFVSSYTSDKTNFQGYAVNAKLPFKNIHAGSLTEYLMNKTTAKFLTLFTIPVIFACEDDNTVCYNDISFVNPGVYPAGLFLRQTYYIDGVQQSTTDKQITDSDTPGVYTVQPDNPSCNHDRVDLTIFTNAALSLNGAAEESTFAQISGNRSVTFVTGASPDFSGSLRVSSFLPGQLSNIAYVSFRVPSGSYTVGGTTNVVVNSGTGTYRVRYFLLNQALQILDTSNDYEITAGSPDTWTESLTANQEVFYIGLQYIFQSGSGNVDMSGTLVASHPSFQVSETKTVEINCNCFNHNVHLGWLNYLGGFDYWSFRSGKDHLIDIGETTEANKNILTNWPNSYGAYADTLRYETSRMSSTQLRVRSQYVTEAQIDAIKFIKTSPLVQIINSADDRRTVLVDTDSFTVKRDEDKLYSIEFTITYTDQIPSQAL